MAPGQTPMVIHSLNEPDDNPYADRGFKRGNDAKPKLRKFLCCFSLSFGILCSSFYDIVLVMVWLTLSFAHARIDEQPFYLLYMAGSISRLFYFFKFNKHDTQEIRYNLYRIHRLSTIVVGLIQVLQIVTILVWDKVFDVSLLLWLLFSLPFGVYLTLVHWQKW